MRAVKPAARNMALGALPAEAVRAQRGAVNNPALGRISPGQIRAYCEALARRFRPHKIVLFGSYACGEPTLDSDIDLLVIMPYRGNAAAKARQIRASLDAPFPLDLLVRRPEFIAQRLQERDMFVEGIMAQGRVMYESQHT